MLRPKKKSSSSSSSTTTTSALPVIVTSSVVPRPTSNGGAAAASSRHHHHPYRRIKSHSSSSRSTIIGLMTTPREKLKMFAVSVVFLVSVLCVFTMAIRSTTRNLDHQMHQTSSQEKDSSLNSVVDHHQQRRSMTEQQQQQLAAADTTTTSNYNYDYDLIVIGAGPAGLTASLFGARAGLSVLTLGSTASSQLYQATVLDNFPSFFIDAAMHNTQQNQQQQVHQDWLKATQRQAAAAGVHFALSGVTVNRIITPTNSGSGNKNPYFGLELSIHEAGRKNIVTARSVIVATGAVEKRLDLPGEAQLWSKSVHSCAICDGSLYHAKTAVVLGGGDAAVEAALLLSRIATKVIVVHRRNSFRASDQHNVQTLQNLPNVQLYTPFVLQRYEVSNEQELTGVVVQNTKTKAIDQIACDGVFVMIGSKPNTEFIQGTTLELDPEGYLVVVQRGGGGGRTTTTTTTTSTSVPGIFAAGQVADKTYRQAITAAAEGAQAAIDAERWMRQAFGSSSITSTTSRTMTRVQRQLPVVPLQTIDVKDMNNNVNSNPQQQVMMHNEGQKSLLKSNIDCDLTKEECIQATVRRYAVVVFSKPYCPYCKKALAALEMEGIKADGPHLHVIDLTATPDGGQSVQATLQKMTGRRTVPNVFVGAKSIGGGDETSQLRASGELRKLVDAAKANAVPTTGGVSASENDKDTGDDDCDLTLEECIRSVTRRHPVVVFSKPYCPYCKKALAALEVEGVHTEPYLHVIDLTERSDNGRAVQATLQKMTGRRTVPNVFVGGNSIGGGDETSQLHRQEKLKPLLDAAKAFATTSTS